MSTWGVARLSGQSIPIHWLQPAQLILEIDLVSSGILIASVAREIVAVQYVLSYKIMLYFSVWYLVP